MPIRINHKATDGEAGVGSHESTMQRSDLLKWRGGTIAAFVSLLAVWFILSIVVRPWVPTPAATVLAMYKALGSAEFYQDLLLTLGRVLVAFAGATIIGSTLGIATGLSRRADAFFRPLLAIALAIPDPVYIIFAILALGIGEQAGFVALTIAITPFVANIVRSSVHARDFYLDEMVQVYRIPIWTAFWHNLVPQLVPALLTAVRNSFALSWKLVVVVEALGQPEGLGAAIFQSFRLLRMREMLALAILFTILMELIERGALGRLERRLLRWRQ
mgnify:CR=1 FL=1|jgi:NitT/TauT family transport system permease protein